MSVQLLRSKPHPTRPAANGLTSTKKKLSYKLQRELDQLPALLEQLEQKLEALQQETSAADFYQQEHEKVAERLAALQQCETELEAAMERWVELESMQ